MNRNAFLIVLAICASGCNRKTGNPAPPRVDTPPALPKQSSTIVVPVSAPLADLATQLNAKTPVRLWQIDKAEPRCVPAKRVRVLGRTVKVTPQLGCRIVGVVTRGPIQLGGSGNVLTIRLPIRATISARDVGGVAGETATGAAIVRATARLSVDDTWSPVAKVDIAYDWTEEPGVDFLGQRIRFADKADEKLKGIIAKLERDLPEELEKLRTRQQLEAVWRKGFTSIQLNRDRPPAWMRITPRRLGFGGYRIGGGRIELRLAAEAVTETFVGNRPADPVPTPLPPADRTIGPQGLRFFIPVLADYRQLEPVVSRALVKLAAKGISLTGVGPVDATFGKVTIYATEGGRLSVGVHATVKPRNGLFKPTKGEIWLSAIPYNNPGSQVVRVRDMKLAGESDSQTVNLLFTLFDDTVVQASIQDSLTHDFAKDYRKVLTAAQRAIAGRREGDFLLSANVDKVVNGQIAVTGGGLFLPVQVQGTANIRFAPLK